MRIADLPLPSAPLFVAAAGLALALTAATPAGADEAAEARGLVVKSSPHGVTETLDRLEKALTAKGINVFARIDHAAGAEAVDQALPPTQVLIFGNPKIGTPLMQSDRRIGIDLPLKVLAWSDADGTTRIAYNSPDYLARRHRIDDRAKVFATMARALDKLTGAATRP